MNKGQKKDVEMERFFRALADRTRLRLINMIADDDVCVCFFVEVLGLSQPVISRHLAYLRRAGLVRARREGKWMHYRIVQPVDLHAAEVLAGVRNWLASDPEMQRERKRLVKVCCAPELPIQLRGAPRPALAASA